MPGFRLCFSYVLKFLDMLAVWMLAMAIAFFFNARASSTDNLGISIFFDLTLISLFFCVFGFCLFSKILDRNVALFEWRRIILVPLCVVISMILSEALKVFGFLDGELSYLATFLVICIMLEWYVEKKTEAGASGVIPGLIRGSMYVSFWGALAVAVFLSMYARFRFHGVIEGNNLLDLLSLFFMNDISNWVFENV